MTDAEVDVKRRPVFHHQRNTVQRFDALCQRGRNACASSKPRSDVSLQSAGEYRHRYLLTGRRQSARTAQWLRCQLRFGAFVAIAMWFEPSPNARHMEAAPHELSRIDAECHTTSSPVKDVGILLNR